MTRIPTHPGEMLLHEFMKPYGLSSNKVAKMLGVPANRISELVAERRSMTADTALRLERLFGMPVYMWMGFQQAYDVAVASKAIDLSAIKPFKAAA
jgi:antitoxin HigA-1